jgi:hypothetical protein
MINVIFQSGTWNSKIPQMRIQKAIRVITNRTLVFVIVLLSACTTVGSDVSQNASSISPEKGIVIFSTSSEETSLSFSWRMGLVEGETQKIFDKVAILLDSKSGPPASFTDRNTHVRSLNLKAGKYYFYPLPNNPFFKVSRTPIFSFTVEAGVITYIGNVLLANQSGLSIVSTYRDRDVNYYMERNPLMRTVDTKTGIMVTDRYLSPESGARFKINGTIWDAPK